MPAAHDELRATARSPRSRISRSASWCGRGPTCTGSERAPGTACHGATYGPTLRGGRPAPLRRPARISRLGRSDGPCTTPRCGGRRSARQPRSDGPVVTGERLAHHCDQGCVRPVPLVEEATLEQRYSHRLKVAGCHCLHIGDGHWTVRRPEPSLDFDLIRRERTREGRRSRCPSRGDTGNGPEPRQQHVIEGDDIVGIGVVALRDRDGGGENALGSRLRPSRRGGIGGRRGATCARSRLP